MIVVLKNITTWNLNLPYKDHRKHTSLSLFCQHLVIPKSYDKSIEIHIFIYHFIHYYKIIFWIIECNKLSVLMLVTISSFLLPSDSSGKLTTNGFSLLGSLLYLIYFGNSLPFHEVNVPIVGEYIIFSQVCNVPYYNNFLMQLYYTFIITSLQKQYCFQSYYTLTMQH